MHSSTGLKIALIVAAATVQMILPLLGHRAMLRILRALVPPFVVLFVLLAILDAAQGPPRRPAQRQLAGHDGRARARPLLRRLRLADERQRLLALPAPDASPRKIVWSVALGGYIPTTLLSLLGAALFTIPAIPPPMRGRGHDRGLPHAFSGWFFWPYLVFVIAQLFAINSIDLYSSGLTLQAMFPAIKRWQCVLLDTVVAGAPDRVRDLLGGFQHLHHRLPAVHDHLDRAVGGDLPRRLLHAPGPL